jgi:DUF1009 family protein
LFQSANSKFSPFAGFATHAGAVIGLIAGSRSLPFLFAKEARRRGERIVAAAFEGETDPALVPLVDEIVWLKVGQLGKMIDVFASRSVLKCVMLGQIAPKNLFDLRPDLRAMALLFKLKEKNAHTLFGAIADELAKDGVELVPAVPWLQPWMPDAGYRVGPSVGRAQEEDVRYGWGLAKEVSRLEIGQSVVVKDGTTLAVEAFEGTDACLERGGKLAGKKGGAVAVKVAKANHDMRFDIPCLGPRTIEVCAEHGVDVLAFEAGKTLLIDQEKVESLAAAKRISVVAWNGAEVV